MRIREKRTHFRQGKPRLTRGKRGGGESRGERKDRSVWRGEIEAHDGDERKSVGKEERSRWEFWRDFWGRRSHARECQHGDIISKLCMKSAWQTCCD